jgi:hypothetical protein
MLVYPFDFKRISSWIYLTLPPYLLLVCRDLAYSGYRRLEILRAYALFLVLLPVVLTGVKNSLVQIFFGVKAQFGRTPKIDHRTPVPLMCTCAILALLGWAIVIFHADIVRGDRLHALFAFSNVVALGYGVVAMIGLRCIGEDVANAVVGLIKPAYQKFRVAFGPRTASKPAIAVPTLRLLVTETEPHIPPSARPERWRDSAATGVGWPTQERQHQHSELNSSRSTRAQELASLLAVARSNNAARSPSIGLHRTGPSDAMQAEDAKLRPSTERFDHA